MEPITAQTTSTQVSIPNAQTDADSSPIASDFETFLRMLTVQMQNQDPLNPVDSSDYAVQLATFSGVEQAVLTNDLLKSLTTQMNTSGLTELSAWVGRDVRAAAPTYFDGNPISLPLKPASTADRADLIVRDENGVEVQRMQVPLAQEELEWAGVDLGGYPLPDGLYSFELHSQLDGEVIAQSPVETYGRVVEVRRDGNDYVLFLKGGATVGRDVVTGVRDAAT
ncbi:flagellar hook capping FlgD N-terminal domain-containing protein [Yoonia sp. 2307UL14-13]|uniref:flagellar hook capping FlgD N-terminal domain-containing protein n=1 Tax=Yoonia sp. 2307UL14-13 TaxID=3126506 RepID=UPI00309DE8A9